MQTTVLVIDDCAATARLIAAYLRREMIAVEVEQTGRGGLERVASMQPDLVLLDVCMPDISGFDVCRALKQDPGTTSIPVIFLTGETDTQQKINGLDLGAVDYITKPFDVAELLARVRAALRTKHLLDLLADRARIDGLTTLANRASFEEQLRQQAGVAVRKDQPLGLLMADLDHFKPINDEHGHAVGDRVLQQVGQTLQTVCRSGESPCRFGGEEFAVIIPAPTDEDALRSLGERLRRAIRDIQVRSHDRVIELTVSVGGAVTLLAGADDEDRKLLIEAADANLYQAKHEGRDRVIVTSVEAAQSCRAGEKEEG